jgi:peroxiredoxin
MTTNKARPFAPPSLAEQTRRTAEAFIAGLPEAEQQIVGRAFEHLLASDVAANAKKTGDPAPDFELPEIRRGSLRLSALLGRGPVVLSFYRGSWCPFCNLEIKALHEQLPAITALGATLVAVSPELPENARKITDAQDIPFALLTDRGNAVAREYGLIMTIDEELRPLYLRWGLDVPAANGDDSFELPVPATYVIDRDGSICAAHVDKDYTRRMEPADIIGALERIQR